MRWVYRPVVFASSSRPRILFEDFVEKCAAVARTTATSLECVLDLDFLLRRAACLDPEAFTSVMSRYDPFREKNVNCKSTRRSFVRAHIYTTSDSPLHGVALKW